MASLSSAPMQSFCLFTEETDHLVHTPLLAPVLVLSNPLDQNQSLSNPAVALRLPLQSPEPTFELTKI